MRHRSNKRATGKIVARHVLQPALRQPAAAPQFWARRRHAAAVMPYAQHNALAAAKRATN
jgi:hypothetical protein